MAEFRFLTADEWGMTWKRSPVPEKLNDPEVYVHHTAGNRMGLDAIEAFQALNRYAQDAKNYSALDYDILVHRNVATGLITIGAGRSEWMSAATLDRNELGEAICVMGYFHPGHPLSEQPHPDEVEGVARGIVWGMEKGWIAKDAVILGHRDNPAHPGATGCPGDFLYAHMDTIRRRVAELLAPPVVTPPTQEVGMNTPIIRVKGWHDQFLCIPISGDTKSRLGPSPAESVPVVVEAVDRAEFERRAGYKLTPYAGE